MWGYYGEGVKLLLKIYFQAIAKQIAYSNSFAGQSVCPSSKWNGHEMYHRAVA